MTLQFMFYIQGLPLFRVASVVRSQFEWETEDEKREEHWKDGRGSWERRVYGMVMEENPDLYISWKQTLNGVENT